MKPSVFKVSDHVFGSVVKHLDGMALYSVLCECNEKGLLVTISVNPWCREIGYRLG